MYRRKGDPVLESTESARVLIVDDDDVNRALLRDVLTAEGMTVVGDAADGAEGVRLAASLSPDVVVMDVSMPVMDGIEATRVIKAASSLIRVVILTGSEAVLPVTEAKQADADAFLFKGGPPEVLIKVIETAWREKLRLER
jgi:DNA-binding NarL/FixJ family response regulator